MGHFASRVPEQKGADMSRDIVKGNWKPFRGEVKAQWSKLTDDPVAAIAGNRGELAGKMQESYGVTKGGAERQSRTSRSATKMPAPRGCGSSMACAALRTAPGAPRRMHIRRRESSRDLFFSRRRAMRQHRPGPTRS